MTDKEYAEWLQKFETKKTTDDCYTPPNIYSVVKEWCIERYHLTEDTQIIRPFYPGGDYENEEYPEGCVVIDNPPFSIMSKIIDFYNEHGVQFFLFCQGVTGGNAAKDRCSFIGTGAQITYKNGAIVNTSFVTNMEKTARVVISGDLRERLDNADAENRKQITKNLPKYEYPDFVLTGANCQKLARWGVNCEFSKDDTAFIRKLDGQTETKKAIYGGGWLLSTKAAAEKAAAEKAGAIFWPISDTERAMIAEMDERNAS